MTPASAPVVWRRLDVPGHDSARLTADGEGWRIDGAAVFLEAGQACRLDYTVSCDRAWRTLAARVSGWLGDAPVALDIRRDPHGAWTLNGAPVPAVAGCDDVDLSFTPATNLLPLRRLHLEDGAQAPVRAAWLRVPELTLEPLDQRYGRVTATQYHYESDGGAFVADLAVRADGFVVAYPGASGSPSRRRNRGRRAGI